jgi:V/A-type H+-transporting ATPase subunit E
MILEVVKAWQKDQGVELSLPENLKKQADQAFEKSLAKEIVNLKIDFSSKLKGGFKIARKDSGYQVVFTDEDFIEFFKPFLKDKTQELLFD